MIRLSRYLLRKLFRLLVWSILLVGLLVGALQLLLPYSDAYRGEVAEWLGGMLGQPVAIGRMNVGWGGLRPELVLHDLRLGSPGDRDSSLHLDELGVEIAILDSLRERRPAVRRVAVRGARLQITRQPDGSILAAESPPAGVSFALSALPARLELVQSEVVWHDLMRHRAPVRLENLNLTLRNDGLGHQARADFLIEGGRLELAADLQVNETPPDQGAAGWSADIYLKGEGLPFKRANDWLPAGYRLGGRYHRIEGWSRWENGVPLDLEGSVELRGLELTTPETVELPIQLKQLAATFRWRAEEEGGAAGRLDLADLNLGAHKLGAISARLRRDGDDLRLEAGFDNQKIEGLLAALSSAVTLPAAAREALAGLRPRGGLEGLRVTAATRAEGFDWSLGGWLRDLNTEPWGDVPGIANLTGAFRAGPEGGAFRLASQNVAVGFRTLFRDPIELVQANGLIEWGRGDQGSWVVDARELIAESPDIRTRSRLRMEFPADAAASPFLDLQTDFIDGDASTTHKYLPTGIMDDDVVGWLDRAIVSGRVVSGACIVRGTLRDFPYQGNDRGRFEVLFDVRDMQLDYWPGWPPIQEMAARVRFWNDRFDTWVSDGRLYDSRLRNTHGWIDRLSESTPFELDGATTGPLADQLRLLRESPLAEDFAALTEGVKGKGTADLKLEFGIPLDRGEFRLDGRLRLRNASLQKEGYSDALNALNGEIRFDDKGVKARGIKGQLRKTPLSLDLEPVAGRPGVTLARAVTRMDPATWQEKIPELLRPRLQGATEVEVQLELPPLSAGPDEPIRLRLLSELEGLAIDLPAPVGKSGEQTRALRVETLLGGHGELPVEISWGDLLSANLRLDRPAKGEPKPPRGILRIGSGTPPSLPDSGLHLTGRLARLHLDPWLELSGKLAESSADAKASPKQPKAAKGRQEPPPPLAAEGWGGVTNLDLKVDHLLLGEEELKKFHLDLAPSGKGLAGHIASNRVTGALFLPGPEQQKPPVVRLSELRLKLDPEASDTAPAEPSARDPRGLRGLDLQSEKLFINDRDFGQLTLLALPVERGLEIRTVELRAPADSLTGSGEWLHDGTAGVHTQLELKLKSAALGEVLTGLGYTPQMKGGATEMEVGLRWPGDPAGFSKEGLSGKLQMQIGSGTLEEMEPGFGRVFGLLNFTALQRRLRLDFRDMFNKGFSFDRISGNFRLEQGSAHTDDLRLESPAARVDLQGRIGFVAKDFDQTATVTGHFSTAIPLAGTIAGGPAVGAALLLAQRLVGDRVDAISSVRYKITGPWSDPAVNGVTPEPDASSNRDNNPDLEGMTR